VDELGESDFDLVVARTDKTIVMIEGFGEEIAEPEMLAAIMEAHRINQDVIAMQHELVEALGLPRFEPPSVAPDPLRQTFYDRFGRELRELKAIQGKAD